MAQRVPRIALVQGMENQEVKMSPNLWTVLTVETIQRVEIALEVITKCRNAIGDDTNDKDKPLHWLWGCIWLKTSNQLNEGELCFGNNKNCSSIQEVIVNINTSLHFNFVNNSIKIHLYTEIIVLIVSILFLDCYCCWIQWVIININIPSSF